LNHDKLQVAIIIGIGINSMIISRTRPPIFYLGTPIYTLETISRSILLFSILYGELDRSDGFQA